nr:casein kinase I homolog HRR25-like [Ciona intestinalis]|eukprot:XP_002125412.3 casein kinase I homolog HRR25-like [Ciona intestinalis]
MLEPLQRSSTDILNMLREETESIRSEQGESVRFHALNNICYKMESFRRDLENLINAEKSEILPEEFGLGSKKNVKLGGGSFGVVYKSNYKGTSVAVKVMNDTKDENNRDKELNYLKVLRHDNIIGFRGCGMYQSKRFIVLEYIKENLYLFTKNYSSDDGEGLSAFMAWGISKQLANVMNYLHSRPMTHGDLKPDNILVDRSTVNPRIKLCDFGLACRKDEYTADKSEGHVRYKKKGVAENFDGLLEQDVFCFGLIVLFVRTGKRPWNKVNTSDLTSQRKQDGLEVKVKQDKIIIGDEEVSKSVGGELEEIISVSCKNGTSFEKIVTKYFSKENPFKMKEIKGEFFSCGFLTQTNIFVADSVVAEEHENEVKFPTYQPVDLECVVDVTFDPKDNVMNDVSGLRDEKLENTYLENIQKYKKQAQAKIIDNNKTIALRSITPSRPGDDEKQRMDLRFVESNYVHHRAMRDIWRDFDEEKKNKIVSRKSDVHPHYSTSFGLHVAVLTCEDDGTRKFVFSQRSQKKGMASPGDYTCGAVESCSVVDYIQKTEKFATVSLINTAARGLSEELGLHLQGEDIKAICLNTIYLKFDNHEWGMCGFVDLTDKRISQNNRLNFKTLNGAFTAGPKDKFEHALIVGVDFKLETMVAWLRKEHLKLASSTKIAAVKVLESFFGTSEVMKMFEKYNKSDK